jgi:hypothetical protein
MNVCKSKPINRSSSVYPSIYSEYGHSVTAPSYRNIGVSHVHQAVEIVTHDMYKHACTLLVTFFVSKKKKEFRLIIFGAHMAGLDGL